MKDVFIILVAALVFAACSTPTTHEVTETESPATQKTAVEKARDLYDDAVARTKECKNSEELDKLMTAVEKDAQDLDKELQSASEQDAKDLEVLKNKLEKAVAERNIALLSAGGKEAALRQLDSCLAVSAQWDAAKEKRIDTLRNQLAKAGDPRLKYDITISLCREYSSYQYDSAFTYACRAEQLAHELGDDWSMINADCARVFCLNSAGFYKEAFETFAGIKLPATASRESKAVYYETAARINYGISDYNTSSPFRQDYVDRGNTYTDSLLLYLPEGSLEWWVASSRRHLKQVNIENGYASFVKVLSFKNLDEHTRAIALSSIGWIMRQQGRHDEEIIATARAAMSDLRSSTKETTALCSLAELLYQDHDVQRATEYIHVALQQSLAYGSRQRQVQVGNILPIIEAERNDILMTQRTWLMVFAVIATLMAIVIALLGWQALKKSRKLKEANDQIAQRNELLEQTNLKLKEADKIKDVYIGNSLYGNSVYMSKLEKIFTMLGHKVAARKYDDLRDMLGGALLKQERNDLFVSFDTTFLHLFPTFIAEYSSLFAPEDQPHIKPGESLTIEMRIFALIRLGITDSGRIAQFLDKSVHTINTYKSRVKNRSLLKNEDFEPRIMLIGVT